MALALELACVYDTGHTPISFGRWVWASGNGGPLFCRRSCVKIGVYIDSFNLYYGLFKYGPDNCQS